MINTRMTDTKGSQDKKMSNLVLTSLEHVSQHMDDMAEKIKNTIDIVRQCERRGGTLNNDWDNNQW